MINRPIVIVGAGITGCVAAYDLSRRGHKIVLIEKNKHVGGLARTFKYNGFSFDIGPHRFYTQDTRIFDFITSVLKNDYNTLLRHSEVYFINKYYPWPLRPTILFGLPLKTILKSSWDLLLMIIKNDRKKVEIFEDYILKNYGPSLYNTFFKDYTRKFLGLSPRQIHSEWAKEGMKKTIIDENIASRNLFDILKLFFIFKPLLTEFIYPEEGIGVFCERLAEETKKYSGEVLTNVNITHIDYSAGEIEEVLLNGIRIKPKTIIWTGSMGEICDLLDLSREGINYLSLILFNVEINKPLNKSFQWCYYGNKEIIFSRVTMPLAFSKKMTPKGKSGLCVEVSCREGDQQWNNPEALVEQVKNDLIKMSLIDQPEDIENVHIERIPNAYPIYTLNYPYCVKKVKEEVERFRNLILAGRTGLFWYNNMDDSIRNGLEAAENVIRGIK